jgi:hypothetical protein
MSGLHLDAQTSFTLRTAHLPFWCRALRVRPADDSTGMQSWHRRFADLLSICGRNGNQKVGSDVEDDPACTEAGSFSKVFRHSLSRRLPALLSKYGMIRNRSHLDDNHKVSRFRPDHRKAENTVSIPRTRAVD